MEGQGGEKHRPGSFRVPVPRANVVDCPTCQGEDTTVAGACRGWKQREGGLRDGKRAERDYGGVKNGVG